MARAMRPRGVLSVAEALLAHSFQLDALLNVLERKGLVTKAEVLAEIRRLREQATRAQ